MRVVKRTLALLSGLLLASCGTAALALEDNPYPTTETTVEVSHKVFVCKYVGKPGVDERLQTGDNPISVDTNSLRNFVRIGDFFNDAQGRSVAIAFDVGQPEPSVHECPPADGGGTTTTEKATTTTAAHTTTTVKHDTTTYPPTTVKNTTTTEKATTTTVKATTTTAAATTTTVKNTTTTAAATTTSSTTIPATTTTGPRVSLFGVNVFAFCGADFLPEISITFGNRPDLDGQIGVLSFSTGGSVFLTFQSNTTVTIAYPNTTQNVNLIFSLGQETATASVTFPPDCPPATTTTSTTTIPATTTTGATTSTTSTTVAPTTTGTVAPTTTGVTTTLSPTGPTSTLPASTTTLPPTFSFGAAATVCVREVPTIRIVFQNQFPQLAGQTGTLTMADVNGNVVSTQPLVYQPGATVDLLYPGTRVNADGTIADVPGWNLNGAGFWVRDPSDEFLRAGINLTYTVNPTATAFVTYPPESANCANPDGPFPPGVTPPPTGLPHTGSTTDTTSGIAFLMVGAGTLLAVASRRRKIA